MNVISQNRCPNIGEVRALLDVIFSSMKVGSALIIQKKEEEFEVKLVEG